MRNNSIWFQSPVPRPRNEGSKLGSQQDNDHDEERQNSQKSCLYSPVALPTTAKSQERNTLSPMSQLMCLDFPGYRDLLCDGQMYDLAQQNVEDILMFSDEEENHHYQEKVDLNSGTIKETRQYSVQKIRLKRLKRSELNKMKESELKHQKPRPREKGLKKLTERAFDIVSQLKRVTYKEVATKLVQELRLDAQIERDSKEQLNVKRRVYDALNVLIALGALRKEGGRIVSDRMHRKEWRGKHKSSEEIESLNKKLALKEYVIYQKRKKYIEIGQKLQAIKSLIKRNQESNRTEGIVHFPFIGAPRHNLEADSISLQPERLVLLSGEPFQPFGDIDTLSWFGSGSFPSSTDEP